MGSSSKTVMRKTEHQNILNKYQPLALVMHLKAMVGKVTSFVNG
jgi:hypothetical protein